MMKHKGPVPKIYPPDSPDRLRRIKALVREAGKKAVRGGDTRDFTGRARPGEYLQETRWTERDRDPLLHSDGSVAELCAGTAGGEGFGVEAMTACRMALAP